ncbi:hypothetical protein G6F57_019710 [Rhizopus arrhizus]|nr:hypothetical protein G6F57_019710 [Rhizopus arrhizus]
MTVALFSAAVAAGRIQVDAAARGGDGTGRQGVIDNPPATAVAAPMIRVGIPSVAATAAADIDKDAGLAGRRRVDALVAVLVDEVRGGPLAVVAVVRVIAARAAGAVRAAIDVGQRLRLGVARPAEHIQRR